MDLTILQFEVSLVGADQIAGLLLFDANSQDYYIVSNINIFSFPKTMTQHKIVADVTCTNFVTNSNLIFKYTVGDLATQSGIRAFGSTAYVITDGLDATMSGAQLNIETSTKLIYGFDPS